MKCSQKITQTRNKSRFPPYRVIKFVKLIHETWNVDALPTAWGLKTKIFWFYNFRGNQNLIHSEAWYLSNHEKWLIFLNSFGNFQLYRLKIWKRGLKVGSLVSKNLVLVVSSGTSHLKHRRDKREVISGTDGKQYRFWESQKSMQRSPD